MVSGKKCIKYWDLLIGWTMKQGKRLTFTSFKYNQLNHNFYSRKNAIDKAKSMTSHIAYPDELLDDKKLNEFYNNVRN